MNNDSKILKDNSIPNKEDKDKIDKIDLSIFIDDYLNDAKEGFQDINHNLILLEQDTTNIDAVNKIFRTFHTLKSSSAMLDFLDIAELAHVCEDILDRIHKKDMPVTNDIINIIFETTDALEEMVNRRSKGEKETTNFIDLANRIRKFALSSQSIPISSTLKQRQTLVPTEKIDKVRVDMNILDTLFNLVGELIINKNRLDTILSLHTISIEKTQKEKISKNKKELDNILSAMDHIIGSLQENVSVIRLISINEIFQRFPRMVRDLAKDNNKEIDLVIEGKDIEMDKALLDSIKEPLIHLLRNAISHGVETYDIRERTGKNRRGTIRLTAQRSENYILITVEDDGKGINPNHLRESFIKKGLITLEESKTLSDNDMYNLLFKGGFSTVEKVTDVSGRGIGLNIVKSSTEKIGGEVEMETSIDKGTKFTLRLPLSTTLIQTLTIGIDGNIFVIPSDNIIETIETRPDDIKIIRDREALIIRNEIIPFFRLKNILNINSQNGQNSMSTTNNNGNNNNQRKIALIIHKGTRSIAIGVDRIIDQSETIIKPFGPIAQKFKGFSGGTIMGDGRVALLLDIPKLFGFETLRG